MRFYDCLHYFLKKLRRFVWKKLLESKALLSINYFHRCTLNFPKVQTDVQTYSLLLGTSNFAIMVFDTLFPFLAFFIAHNIEDFKEKFGHVTPAAKGPLWLNIGVHICLTELSTECRFILQ